MASQANVERSVEVAVGPVTLSAGEGGVSVQASTNVEISISAKTTKKYSATKEVGGLEVSVGQGIIGAAGTAIDGSGNFVSSSVRIGVGVDLSPVAARQGIPLPAVMRAFKYLQVPLAQSP